MWYIVVLCDYVVLCGASENIREYQRISKITPLSPLQAGAPGDQTASVKGIEGATSAPSGVHPLQAGAPAAQTATVEGIEGATSASSGIRRPHHARRVLAGYEISSSTEEQNERNEHNEQNEQNEQTEDNEQIERRGAELRAMRENAHMERMARIARIELLRREAAACQGIQDDSRDFR
jgi:hypothetical protein